MSALPLHPAVNHFPVVASLLASGCVLLGALRPLPERREWLLRALLLLGVAAAALPVVIGSGRAWSSAQGLWPPGLALPPGHALNGLLRWHVLGAAVSALLTLAGLGLALAFRRGRIALWPVLLVVLAAALATGVTARLGGQMAFGEVEPGAGP
jgi:uncharacterized membrane protein